MERIYKNISLDIHNDITSQLSLSVKQGDTTRGIRVSLTDHGKVFNIPDSCYAVFSARKSTGSFISDGCTIQNNTIIYDFSEAVVSVASQIDCELTVYSATGNKITSPSFMIFVYKTIEEEYAGEVVESNSFTVLNDLISNATETIDKANKAADNANNSATEANEATEVARASVVYIEKTEDGKLRLLDADRNVIDTVDVCYMDNDTIFRYNNGVLSAVGIKEINADETFKIWVGTSEQFGKLSKQDDNTLYWVTDDNTFEQIIANINALYTGEAKAKKAESADVLTVRKRFLYDYPLKFGTEYSFSLWGNDILDKDCTYLFVAHFADREISFLIHVGAAKSISNSCRYIDADTGTMFNIFLEINSVNSFKLNYFDCVGNSIDIDDYSFELFYKKICQEVI